MDNLKVKELVNYVFAKIEKAKTNGEVKEIFNDKHAELIRNNRMGGDKYPQIHFKITSEELDGVDFLTDDDCFSNNIASKELNPLTKLLYAVCWKNGDLQKVKHIINGIKALPSEKDNKEDALVFYQFGKYLTKRPGEPIVDQHVLRAFEVYEIVSNKAERDLNQVRKKGLITKKDIPLIAKYKQWLLKTIKEELRQQEDYCYFIDQVLFALGKTIKIQKRKVVPA